MDKNNTLGPMLLLLVLLAVVGLAEFALQLMLTKRISQALGVEF